MLLRLVLTGDAATKMSATIIREPQGNTSARRRTSVELPSYAQIGEHSIALDS
jgi:hypothetical protein